MASVLAGKPAQFFVVPDPWVPQIIAGTTPEAGAYPGPATAAGVFGKMVPVQSGEVTEGTADLAYTLSRAGGPGKAEFCFCPVNTGAVSYRGKDDVRHWWGFHSPFTSATPGTDNNAIAWHPDSRNVVVYGGASSTGYVRYRDVDADRYDAWTQQTFTLVNAVASAAHGAALLTLPDGRLLLIQRITGTGGPTHDFDVYQCTNPELNDWQLVSSRIIQRFNPDSTFQTHDTGAQIRVARAGEYIRLVWADNTTPGLLHNWISRDRGISWERLADGPTFRDTGDAGDGVPFDMVGIDDTGSFLLAGVSTTTATNWILNRANGAGAWATGAALVVAEPQNVKALCFSLHPLWIYLFVWWSDTTTAANDGWNIRRGPKTSTGWADPNNVSGVGWESLTSPSRAHGYDGVEWGPGRMGAVWAGPSFAFYGTRKTESGGNGQTTGTAWYSEAWTERSAGEFGPSVQLRSLPSGVLWDVFWTCAEGRPSDAAGTAWTQTTVGTGTDSATPDNFQFTGSAAGDARFYSKAGPLGTWYATGFACEFVVRLDAGDSTTASENVAVRIIAADAGGVNKRDVAVRVSGTQLLVRDIATGTDLTILGVPAIDTGSTGAYTFVRLHWGANGAGGRIQVWSTGTGPSTSSASWSQSSTFTVPSVAGAGFTSVVRFGHLNQTQATQMRSYWREVRYTTDGSVLNFDGIFGVTDPFLADNYLFGAPAAGVPQYVASGLSVAWAGVGGALNDKWDGTIAHTYPVSAIFVDSPRIAWRSVNVATTASIIAWNGASVQRWRHNAIAIFGCNNRNVLVDYDSTTAFSSPTATETVDFTAFGTGTTALTAAVVDGNTLAITTPSGGFRWVQGELVGYYIRATSGAASGKTWKITRHPADNIVQFDELTTALAAEGLAATHTLIIFGPNSAKAYSAAVTEPYIRIRCADAITAEGYHMIGTVVPGRKVAIDVPIDWAHTDDEQPNVTSYRTRSGIAWAFVEGPNQRTISGRVVGDAERWRERFRGMLGAVAYEGRPCALVLDEDRTPESIVLGRVKSGSSLDNASWYIDTNGLRRVAGDLSITFVEEP